MDIVKELSHSFEHYLTIENVDESRAYNYACRGFFDMPIVKTLRHLPKCKAGESWTYIAVPQGASLSSLTLSDRLYVGAQTSDRMFRGDGMGGQNFHHAEMRKGNGNDNLVNFLRRGKSVEVYRIASQILLKRIALDPNLAPLNWLSKAPNFKTQHTGFWLEQAILQNEPRRWRWNTAGANVRVLGQISMTG